MGQNLIGNKGLESGKTRCVKGLLGQGRQGVVPGLGGKKSTGMDVVIYGGRAPRVSKNLRKNNTGLARIFPVSVFEKLDPDKARR